MTQPTDPNHPLETYSIEEKRPVWPWVLLATAISIGSLFIILLSLSTAVSGNSLNRPALASAPTSTPRVGPASDTTRTPNTSISPTAQKPALPHFFTLAEVEAYTQPLTVLDSQNFLDPSQRVEWSHPRCATTQEILDSNLKMMTWQFTINDTVIPFKNFKKQLYKEGDRFCASYYTILDNWRPGAYHLKSAFRISAPINDGQENYSPNTYFFDKYVYVVDSQAAGDPSTWPVVIQDGFNDNSLGWKVGNFDDPFKISSLSIAQGKLTVKIDQAKQVFTHWEFPHLQILSDFKVSIDARLVHGTSTFSDCYGLVFRLAPQGSSLYEFSICHGNQFYLGYLKSNQWTTLIKWGDSPAIIPGQSNNLSVTFQGNKLDCFINGTQVGSVTDATLKDGLIGFAYTVPKDDIAEYEFDNFVLSVPMSPGVQLIPTVTH